MLAGLYSAAAGMAAQQRRIEGAANDLANVSTTGYKQVRVGFRDLLYTAQGPAAGPTVLAGAGAAASFIGRGQGQGPIQETGRPLDLAIQGPGFLQVRRPDGSLALTRDGALRLDATGRLTTKDGLLVEPGVAVPPGTDDERLAVAADGTVRVGDGAPLGRIQLVTVPAPDGLRALGGSLFAATDDSGAAVPVATGAGAAASQLRQGALEGSNVDMAGAMVGLMEAQRSFQLASRAIQMQDQMMEVANQVRR